MSRFSNSLGTLSLLPSTMEKGLFVTNVKWEIKDFRLKLDDQHHYYYSPDLVLPDQIKNKPIKIKLRLVKQPNSNKGKVECLNDDSWKFHSSIYFRNYLQDFECTVGFPYDFYYGSKTPDDQVQRGYLPTNAYHRSKTLVDDLRQYLATIHGETIAFGDKTISILKCSKEVLLAFIDKEYNEDFIIECDGHEFKIKKIILQARSPVFDAMLSTNYFTEGRENRMVINEHFPDSVEKMIEFFETDFVKATIGFEVELYEIARKYLSQSFMEFTRLQFVQKLSMKKSRKLRIVQNQYDLEAEKLMMKEQNSKNLQRRLG